MRGRHDFNQQLILIFIDNRNLLRPSGVRLTPATLTVRIFRAEDLPQMDPEMFHRKKKSALVDPYCTVSFSGIKGKTPVIWGRNDPQWNQQINLPVKVKKLCAM